MSDDVRPLTRLEQLEYLVNFYKALLEKLQQELEKAENELENERLVRRR